MKNILFTIFAISFACIFSNCSKSEQKNTLVTNTNTNIASDRTPCRVEVFPLTYATLTYCGTQSNFIECAACKDKGVGLEVITGDAVLDLDAAATFSISSDFATSVILVTGSNQIGPISIAAGGCELFTVDGSCVISH